ncbi:AraC family transcriptional regulator [Erythrobacter sp. EC-HK427]|uniref:AraC family transcriptional regulator n=1 Tax=Erythrobacter sp. EC-HK427 TaxID=2038396 RepID=UPI0012529F50|nr:AraC family transcriptional regulator [Erythrobacter sp. EC-HK427]VVT01041.1 Transcriptional regulator, AraC family [Erythrobacter sp. EC-HK427]
MNDAAMQADTAAIVATARKIVTGDATVETDIPRLILHQSLAPSGPVPAFYKPSFCAIVQGAKAVRSGVGDLAYGAGQYLIAGFDVPVVGLITKADEEQPYICVQLLFDRQILREMREQMPPRAPIQAIGIAQTPPDLMNALARLVGLLNDPVAAAHLAPLYEREILYRLLTGPYGAQLRKSAYEDERAAPVERAIIHLQKTFRQPFDLAELLSIAARSQSSLYRDFKDATGLSPLQFRTRLRLEEARRMMVSAPVGVAEAGFAVGYESPSQFSRDYRRLYGRAPTGDVERLKNSETGVITAG